MKYKKTSTPDCAKKTNFIDDADHDYILEKIDQRYHIEYERQIHNDDK